MQKTETELVNPLGDTPQQPPRVRQRRRSSNQILALQLTAHHTFCCCFRPCCSCNKQELDINNEIGMSLATTIGVVRYKAWHDFHQIITTTALLLIVSIHLYECVHISNSGATSTTVLRELLLSNTINASTPILTMTECDLFELTHNLTAFNPSSSSSPNTANGSFSILSWFAFAVQLSSGICLFTKHNFDVALVRPIVSTPEVILLIWAGFAMVFLEFWLLFAGVARLFTFAYKLMVVIELFIVVFMDAAVRLWKSFEVLHTTCIVALLILDMTMTVWFSKTDYLLLCLGENQSVVISSFMVQRLIYINMLTSLAPSLIVLCTNRNRTQMRFAEVPVERMSHASLLTEGATGEEASTILNAMTRKNLLLAEKLKHVQKALFNHEFGGKASTMSLEESDALRTDELINSSRKSIHSGSASSPRSTKVVLHSDAVEDGNEDGIGRW